MWPFKRKATVVSPQPPNDMDVLTQLAHNKALKKAEEAIRKVHKEGRLVFKGDDVEYIERDGKKSLQTLQSLSWLMWSKMNDEMTGKLGITGASLSMVKVEPKDILNIILKIREKK